MLNQQAIGVLGGTFNPIHFGHLRAATEFAGAFGLEQVLLMPCFIPVHRELPSTDSKHRVAMLERAITDSQCLQIDMREVDAGRLSYTVDSLTALRSQIGEQSAIYFAMGEDAFASFTTWHRWQDILMLANIVVMSRPGVGLNLAKQPWLDEVTIFAGHQHAFGKVYQLDVTPLNISSTAIRAFVKNQKSIRYLLPDSVVNYIKENKLYRYEP